MAVKNITHKKGVTQIVNINTEPRRKRKRAKRQQTKNSNSKGSNAPPPPPAYRLSALDRYQVPALPVWRQGPAATLEIPQAIQQQLLKPLQDRLDDLAIRRNVEKRNEEKENKYDDDGKQEAKSEMVQVNSSSSSSMETPMKSKASSSSSSSSVPSSASRSSRKKKGINQRLHEVNTGSPFPPDYFRAETGEVKVRNPLTGNYIILTSETYRKLIKNKWLSSDPPPPTEWNE